MTITRGWTGLLGVLLLLGGVLGVPEVRAQDEATDAFSEASEALATDTSIEGTLEGLGFEEGEGLEAAVSGGEYRLGPGDVLAITIWGPQPLAYRLPITLEGNLLIPSVGEIDVNRMLLADAKQRIREAVLRVYHNVEVTVTLTKLRRFQIHILGQVQNPGTYFATSVQRVSFAVSRAGGFLGNASRRRIQVYSADSLRAEADLYAFLKRGLTDRNPYLRDGDRVFVPYSQDQVQVRGQVNSPGAVQFLAGDRLSSMLKLVGGFNDKAFVDTLEVARYPTGDVNPVRFRVVSGSSTLLPFPGETVPLPEVLGTFSPDPDAIPFGPPPVYPDFELQPNDNIFVRGAPEFRLRGLVEVAGEVQYPGAYPYTEGETRISDLIAEAGGLTREASLLEARLIRRETISLQDPEFERLKKMLVSDMDDQEYAYFKAKAREVPGQMVIDFRKALHGGDYTSNVLLAGGDLVVIPPKKNYVNVLGTVERPGNVLHRPGLTAKDYVNLAGGYAEDADKGDSRVIRADGGAWVSFGEAGVIDPGDVVFVPEKGKGNFWRTVRDGLTITTQILTIYLVVDRALQ